MTDLRRNVSPLHLELLLQYMERHPWLALGGPRSRDDQLQARKLWDKVARTLNKVDGSVVKTGKGWCRYWADLKCKTRRKYTSTNKSNPTFAPWERRVIDLLTDDHGHLLPNAHQQAEKEYQNITKPPTARLKRSYSDDTQDSNTETYEQTDKIYIVNNTELTDDHKAKIKIEKHDKNLKIPSNAENYNFEEQNNSTGHVFITTEEFNDSKEVQNTKKRKYSIEDHNISRQHHNNSIENHNISTQNHNISTQNHNNSIEYHNNSREHNNTVELRTKKTVEELKKEILEFQLKRQKELFEMEKRERDERHKLEMDILRLKRDILVKELNNLT